MLLQNSQNKIDIKIKKISTFIHFTVGISSWKYILCVDTSIDVSTYKKSTKAHIRVWVCVHTVVWIDAIESYFLKYAWHIHYTVIVYDICMYSSSCSIQHCLNICKFFITKVRRGHNITFYIQDKLCNLSSCEIYVYDLLHKRNIWHK